MTEPTLEQLENRLARLTAVSVPFEGIVYGRARQSMPRKPTLLTGEGSKRFGSR